MMNTVPTLAARRRTPTWLWLLLIVVMLSVLAVTMVLSWVGELDLPTRVVINGTDYGFLDPTPLSVPATFAVACAIVLALMLALVLIPVALLVALAGVVIGVVFGVGVPLMAVALVLALLCSPVLLVGGLVWWIWSKSQVARPAPAANIAR
jgi:hypothetical protein